MNFKLMPRFLALLLLLLQAEIHRSAAVEIEDNVILSHAIIDADEVRIVYHVSGSMDTVTGYRSMTPNGRKLLAELFSKADFRGLGNPDGTQDPTGGAGFNTDRGMILNIYKNKQLTHELIIIAGDYIHLIIPKDAWYVTSFPSPPKDDKQVGTDEPAIEDMILKEVKKLSASGDWEVALSYEGEQDKVTAQMVGFMPGIIKPAAPKPVPGKRSPQ